MTSYDFFMIWPGNAGLSLVIWLLAAIIILFFARTYSHKLIKSFTYAIHGAARITAASLMILEARTRRRNREVLLASGAEQLERRIEREFERMNAIVTKDLQAYPTLHRTMSDIVREIDEDYRKSTDTPPVPPEWISAVESIAAIPSSKDTMVARMLGEIKKVFEKLQKGAMKEYKKTSRKRHALLRKMVPYWRKASNTLENVDKTMTRLLERSKHIDRMMTEQEGVLAKTDSAERFLSSSSMTQFFISTIVLLIAIGGAIVNFNLIALPMSEMVGGGSYIGAFKTSNVAAMVIILVEATMGIYLMESLRITHLFPIIGDMDDKKRRLFMWLSLLLLVIMACIESSLAFMRDIIAADMQALRQVLAGKEMVEGPAASNIPLIGQMVMGFILPFALAFVAIPFEAFVHSARTVLGLISVGVLNLLAFILRLVGNVALHLGNILINVYDLLTFPFLWVEERLRKRKEPSLVKEERRLSDEENN